MKIHIQYMVASFMHFYIVFALSNSAVARDNEDSINPLILCDGWFNDAVISLDGAWYAAANGEKVFIWKYDTHELVERISFPDAISDYLYFSPDNDRLLVSTDKRMYLKVLSTNQLIVLKEEPFTYNSTRNFHFSHDGQYLLTPSMDRQYVFAWDTHTGEVVHQYGPLENVVSAGFSLDKQTVLISNSNREIIFYDFQLEEAMSKKIVSHNAALCPDGNKYSVFVPIAFGQPYADIKLFNIEDDRLIYQFVYNLFERYRFSPDGRYQSIRNFHNLTIVDTDTGQELIGIEDHLTDEIANQTERITEVASQKEIYMDLRFGSILEFHDLHSGELISKNDGIRYSRYISIPNDGQFLATREFNQILIWDLETKTILNRIPIEKQDERIQVSPQGTFVTALDHNKNNLLLFDPIDGQLMRTLDLEPLYSFGTKEIVISNNERYAIPVIINATPYMIDLENGNRYWASDSHRNALTCAAFSPDNRTVLTGGKDHATILWDAITGAKIRTFSEHYDEVHDIRFFHERRLAIIGLKNHIAEVYDLDTSRKIAQFYGNSSFVDVSADDRHIVVGSYLWDFDNRRLTHAFPNNYEIQDVEFVPHRQAFVLTDNRRNVRIWDYSEFVETESKLDHWERLGDE